MRAIDSMAGCQWPKIIVTINDYVFNGPASPPRYIASTGISYDRKEVSIKIRYSHYTDKDSPEGVIYLPLDGIYRLEIGPVHK